MKQTCSSTVDPTLFIPFKGFDPEPPTALDSRKKLEKIIEHVTAQQEIVRGNKVGLAQKQAEDLVSQAREELFLTEYDNEVEDELARKQKREEADALVESLKIPAKKGAKRQDFEARLLREDSANYTIQVETHDDVEMGGMGTDTVSMPKDRPPCIIRRDLNTSLQSLINSSTYQLETYDTHAAATLAQYKRALSRRTSRSGPGPGPSFPQKSPIKSSTVKFTGVEKSTNVESTPTKTGTSAQVILRKKTGESGDNPGSPNRRDSRSPVDLSKRFSTGMPITGWKAAVEPVRVVESMENLARREYK